jgi:hypothetical protein
MKQLTHAPAKERETVNGPKLYRGSMRDSYMAFFAAGIGSLRYMLDPTVDSIVRVAFAVAVLVWPYFILLRLRDLGLSGWWTIPYCAVTGLVGLWHLSWFPAIFLLFVLHAPLIILRSGRFSQPDS